MCAGMGRAPGPPPGPIGYADQAGDLAAFVDRLGLDRFVLIGTSMGGIIAMAYAVAHPRRLRGLVINDIGPDAEAGTQRITQMVGSRPEEFATLDDAMAYRREMSPIVAGRSAEDQRELALGRAAAASGRKVGLEDGPRLYPAAGRARRASAARIVARAAGPLLPTLVVWGTESDVLSEAQARRMVGALPHGELVEVSGVGHAPTLVEPQSLAALERLLAAL